MGLATITAHVAGTILTAAALNNNFNALANQLNGSVEAVNMADLAITTAKINTDAVTFDKMDDDGNFGPFTGTWEYDAAVNFDGAVDFDSTVDFTGATILGGTPLVFEGATDNAFETSLAITDPTADRTLTMPNQDVNLGEQIIQGWVVFDGTGTPAIGDSYNVTSITDNGAGDYTINWTVAFASGNYPVSGIIKTDAAGATATGLPQGIALQEVGTNPATGSVRIATNDNSGSTIDPDYVCLIAGGNR